MTGTLPSRHRTRARGGLVLLIGPVAWAALAAPAAASTGLELRGDTIDLAVRTTASSPETVWAPTLGGQVDLKARLSGLETSVLLGLETGSKADQAWGAWLPASDGRFGQWSARQLGFGAVWALAPIAKLELKAADQVRSDLDQADRLWSGGDDRHVRARQSSVRVQASLTPLGGVDLQLGGETATGDLRTAASGSAASLVRNQNQQMFMAAQWAPFARLKLEGGGRIETLGVAWRDAGSRAETFSYVEPRVGASLTAWGGARIGLSAEQAVLPVNNDQFVSFAEVAGDGLAASFRPGQEWRYQLSIQQRLPAEIDLKATVTRAAVQSVTDLGPIGAAQAPMAIGGGERSQIDADLAAPVRLDGLPDLTVKLRGSWRGSEVTDPFTGAPRRLSGEAPYDAELTVGPTAAGSTLRWGVAARLRGAASTYQLSQITTQSATAGLGGFVTYTPGPISIQLQLDNLVGGGRTERNVGYQGPRLWNDVAWRSQTRGADRAVRLQISKPL